MISKLIIEYVAKKDIVLKAALKGNLIRSAIGATLKEDEFSYNAFFRGKIVQEMQLSPDPVPFFAPHYWDEQTEFAEGDVFTIGIILFAPILTWPVFYEAFEKMFQKFGFELQTIHAAIGLEDESWTVVDAENGDRAEALPEFSIPEIMEYYWIEEPLSSLQIDLESPFRIIRADEVVKKMSFADAVFACVRRIKQIHAIDCLYSQMLQIAEPELNLDALEELAQTSHLATSETDVTWQDWWRRSTAGESMNMGGIVGTIAAQGHNLAPFLPLLGIGQMCQIGGKTTMGNGIIALTCS